MSLPDRETKAGIELRPTFEKEVNIEQRAPVQASLGCHVEMAALPHVDPDHGPTRVGGFKYRTGSKLPYKRRSLLRRLCRFVRHWVKKHMVPLDPDSFKFDLEDWLSKTNYPEWRKEELRKVYKDMLGVYTRDSFRVDGFIKDETYPDWKAARVIMARADQTKTMVGPIFKAIEEQLFKMKYFIKKVPKADRPRLIYNTLYDPMARYFCTDFSSFESSFDPEIMWHLEFILYRYMTKYIPEYNFFMWFCYNVIAGVNRIHFYDFIAILVATRQSGEMNTSLGNGFSNLMILLFVARESGYDPEIFECFVEGDDSISQTYVDRPMNMQIYQDLGFSIKSEYHDDIGKASFCGNLFHPEDFITVTDIAETICSFGWTKACYARSKKSKKLGLLRAKAMSLLYEYPGCPILQSLGLYAYRITKGYRARLGKQNEYERYESKQMLDYIKVHGLPIKEIPMSTRLFVEEVYGITVTYQLCIEKYLDSLNKLTVLDNPYIHDIMKPVWREYSFRYVRSYSDKTFTRFPFFDETPGPKYDKQYIKQLMKSVDIQRTHLKHVAAGANDPDYVPLDEYLNS